jgi:hypothetical protein
MKGCWKLWKIGFDLQSCDDAYHLQGALKYFLYAERKEIQEAGQASIVEPKYLRRPRIIQHLPQFSEAVYARIREIRIHQDSKLSGIRPVKTKRPLIPQQDFDFPRFCPDDSFLRNNEALFLTFTGNIPGIDHCDES